jgi:L-ascorbate metabolism protein UlaG (beta-lactamase superfamily)
MTNCRISLTGAVYMNIFGLIKIDFQPASIKVEFDDKFLYIDPFVTDDSTKADYIFITHNHLDHFSMSDINKLLKRESIVIGPKSVTKKFKDYETKTVSIGDTVNLDRIRYEVVESYNFKSNMHKKGSKYVGYVISIDTTRIYVAGDTDFIPEMGDLKNISVAIVPIGEGKTAMNPQSAANAINLIKPKIVIPVHYELGKNREQDFLKHVDKDIKVKFIDDFNASR